MNTFDQPPLAASPLPPPRKKHGCFFYGCITTLVVLFLVVIATFFAVRYGINRFNRMVVDYTDTSSVSVPKAEMTPEETKELNDRVAAFNNALNAHSNAPPLVLNSRDINILLSNSPQLKDYKDEFYVSLNGDKIEAQVSLPMDTLKKLPIVNTKGRYFNGSGTFKAYVNNGVFSVYVQDLQVRGKPLPENILRNLRSVDLAQGFTNNPSARWFQEYESIQIRDSTLIIRAKAQ